MIQKIENKPSANLIITEYSVQTTGNALKKWTACEELWELNLYEKDKSTFDLFHDDDDVCLWCFRAIYAFKGH